MVRLSSIGDVVHTLPALAALRRAGHDVDWLVEPAARPLLEGQKAVARLVPLPAARAVRLRDGVATARTLRAARYDVALDFQGLWKSALWTRLSGARRTIGYAAEGRREPASAWLLGERVPPPPAPHVIDKNLALLKPLGIEAVGSREFPLPTAPEAAQRVDAALAAVDRRLSRAETAAR
jgi:heptosyltransferase-1